MVRVSPVEQVQRFLVFAITLGVVATGLFLPNSTHAEDAGTNEYETAHAWMAKKNWAEAVAALRKLNIHSTHPEVALDLAKSLVYSGRREEALSVLSHAAERQSGEIQIALIRKAKVISQIFLTNGTFLIYQEGLNFLVAQQYRSAKERLDKALDLEPDNVEILVRMGQTQLLSGDIDSSAERLRLAKKLNPHQIEIRLWLGRVLYLRGELALALEELHAASEELRDSEEAQDWYADALVLSGQRQLAIQNLERNLKLKPLHLQSLVNLAKLKFQVSGRDNQSLWGIRKDLQLAQSRLADYEALKPVTVSDTLTLDLRDIPELKTQIQEMSQKVEARLATAPQAET